MKKEFNLPLQKIINDLEIINNQKDLDEVKKKIMVVEIYLEVFKKLNSQIKNKNIIDFFSKNKTEKILGTSVDWTGTNFKKANKKKHGAKLDGSRINKFDLVNLINRIYTKEEQFNECKNADMYNQNPYVFLTNIAQKNEIILLDNATPDYVENKKLLGQYVFYVSDNFIPQGIVCIFKDIFTFLDFLDGKTLKKSEMAILDLYTYEKTETKNLSNG